MRQNPPKKIANQIKSINCLLFPALRSVTSVLQTNTLDYLLVVAVTVLLLLWILFFVWQVSCLPQQNTLWHYSNWLKFQFVCFVELTIGLSCLKEANRISQTWFSSVKFFFVCAVLHLCLHFCWLMLWTTFLDFTCVSSLLNQIHCEQLLVFLAVFPPNLFFQLGRVVYFCFLDPFLFLCF